MRAVRAGWVFAALAGGCVGPMEAEPLDPYAADFLYPAPGHTAPVASEAPAPPDDVAAEDETRTVRPEVTLATRLSAGEDEDAEGSGTILMLAPDVARACEISTGHTYFDPGSSAVGRQQEVLLEALAQCLLTGPLATGTIQVIGWADPTGDPERNALLALDRAKTVARHLEARGMNAERMEILSGGDTNAPTDPAQWPERRRVEIRLAL